MALCVVLSERPQSLVGRRRSHLDRGEGLAQCLAGTFSRSQIDIYPPRVLKHTKSRSDRDLSYVLTWLLKPVSGRRARARHSARTASTRSRSSRPISTYAATQDGAGAWRCVPVTAPTGRILRAAEILQHCYTGYIDRNYGSVCK